MKKAGIIIIIIFVQIYNGYSQGVIVSQDSLSNGTRIVLNCSGKPLSRKTMPLVIIKVGELGFIIDQTDSLTFPRINPSWIDNIDVIKGQKAIDKYGEKGVNGVIIVELNQNCQDLLPTSIKGNLKLEN